MVAVDSGLDVAGGRFTRTRIPHLLEFVRCHLVTFRGICFNSPVADSEGESVISCVAGMSARNERDQEEANGKLSQERGLR